MGLKVFNAFFSEIYDHFLEEDGTKAKNSISKQIRIYEMKGKIYNKIHNRQGEILLEWRDLSVKFSQGQSNSKIKFVINENITNFKEKRS